MLTLKYWLRIAHLDRSRGDPGVPVPRDHLPADYYRQRRLEEARRRIDREARKARDGES